MADYVPWAIIHLAALALMLLCAAGFGNLFLRKHRFQNLTERLVFTIALGLGLCALGLFILGLLGILYRSVIWVLTVAGAMAMVLNFIKSTKNSLGISQWKRILTLGNGKDLFSLRNAVIVLLTFLVAACCFLLMVRSQYPPTNWDSISNHLVIARENLKAHRLVMVPGIPTPVLPLLNHMLFTWALAMKDDVLAQMVERTFFILIALGSYAWGKRQNRAALGCAAAALWLAHPLAREIGATAYVDIALTCFVFLGVYALGVFWSERNVSWWYLGIALLAMAAGTKMTGLVFVGLGAFLGLCVLAVTFKHRTSQKRSPNIVPVESSFNWRSFALGLTLAALVAIPWYAFDAYHKGNPFWPFLSEPGGTPNMNGFRNATLANFLLVYLDFFRYPARFDAELHLTLFPLIVVWPLAWIVALFNRSVRWWVVWALAFTTFWFLTIPFIRYWLPVLPMAGLALCESIQWILERIRKSTTLHQAIWTGASVVFLLWIGYVISMEINFIGLPPATPAGREGFLSQMHGYLGVGYVNAHADKNDAVCVLKAFWLNYYFHQRLLNDAGTPAFRWPDDQLWIQRLDSENVKWIVIYSQSPGLNIPDQNPVTKPYWPDYQLVYDDRGIWVFHRKPIRLEGRFNRSEIFKNLGMKATHGRWSSKRIEGL